jgi:hypothetical protein
MIEPTPRFETERTRRFREQDLSEGDERTISDIEKLRLSGCPGNGDRRGAGMVVYHRKL